MKTTASGYSLWLIPKGNAYKQTRELIKKLAKINNAPAFEPHITLLGKIKRGSSEEKIISKTKQLAASQELFTLNFDSFGYEDFYFKTLFIKIGNSKKLNSFHEKAVQIFEIKNSPDFMPHLSILYGNYPESLKKEVIAGIDKTILNERIVINKLYLFKTRGSANEWKKIATFHLNNLS